MRIYSVRDNAVEAYLQPFFSPSNASAVRSLKEAVNDPKHEFHKHAGDYVLFCLGEFDESLGIITGTDPFRIISCVDLLGVD